jgi:glucose/arabinose dehydrogenase
MISGRKPTIGFLFAAAVFALVIIAPNGAEASEHASRPVDAVSGASAQAKQTSQTITFSSEDQQLQLEEILRTGAVIWALDFTGPNTLIFSERTGQLKLLQLDTAKISVLRGGPVVMQTPSGGLFDVLVDPEFDQNQLIYFTYVKAVEGGSTIALARGRLQGDEITDLHDLFVANNASDDHAHWGSRVVMDAQRYLYMTAGDRHVPDNAQDLRSHGGKVLRLKEDGTVPPDNPYVGRDDAAPEVWSLGHRNPQGLAIHPDHGGLFEQEHGPTGGDEINLIEKGRNYGWPVITWGENIYGGQEPLGTAREGMEQPLKYFKPGIAPTGMTFYFGERYPRWQGNIFSSTLRGHVHRLVLDEGRVVKEERMLMDWRERIRDVAEGPDGLLYLATESGAIARIVPAQ